MTPPPRDFAASGLAVRLHELVEVCLRADGGPLLVGLCGPQGSGKSTAAAGIANGLRARSIATAVLSIDDFYLGRADRQALAASLHPLLSTRGPPGTHDVALAEQTIGRLLMGDQVALPVFNKGMDDRSPESQWPLSPRDCRIILFEGWCVGARMQDARALVTPLNALEREEDPDGAWRRFVNASLARYQALFARVDVLTMLRPPSFEIVTRWRQQQEDVLRESLPRSQQAHCMQAAELARFVQHFERITRHILADLPARADAVVDLDNERNVLEIKLSDRVATLTAGERI